MIRITHALVGAALAVGCGRDDPASDCNDDLLMSQLDVSVLLDGGSSDRPDQVRLTTPGYAVTTCDLLPSPSCGQSDLHIAPQAQGYLLSNHSLGKSPTSFTIELLQQGTVIDSWSADDVSTTRCTDDPCYAYCGKASLEVVQGRDGYKSRPLP